MRQNLSRLLLSATAVVLGVAFVAGTLLFSDGLTGSLTARGSHDGRDSILTFSIDLWNVTFPAPGDYSFRILVNGSERKRLPLLIAGPDA